MQCVNAYVIPKVRPTQTHFKINSVSEIGEIPLASHVKSITSTSNPFVKHCVKLRQSSSYRYSHSSLIVLGSTPLREILRFQETPKQKIAAIEYLILLDGAQVPEEFDGTSIRILRVNRPVMTKLCGLQSAESTEAIGLMRFPATFTHLSNDHQEASDHGRTWFPAAHRILALDAIQDPGNLGTLIRSARAFGWDGVFLLPGCCDPFNEKAIRASRGASFQLPIVSGEWAHLEALRIKMLAGHPGEKARELSSGLVESLARTPICFVLGSEGTGLSERARGDCELVKISMPGRFESLNVSVAGGIFLYSLQTKFNC